MFIAFKSLLFEESFLLLPRFTEVLTSAQTEPVGYSAKLRIMFSDNILNVQWKMILTMSVDCNSCGFVSYLSYNITN